MTAPRLAVALRFLAGSDEAPRVVARGRGEVAERILELAKAHGVPVRPDSDLVEALMAVDVGTEAPAELYAALAEVLVWVYRANATAR